MFKIGDLKKISLMDEAIRQEYNVKRIELFGDNLDQHPVYFLNKKPFYCFSLPNALIVGVPSIFGFLRDTTFHVAREGFNYDVDHEFINPALASLDDGDVQGLELSGEWCALYNEHTFNFWHWTMEYLPRAAALEEAGYKGNYIIRQVDNGTMAFVYESLIALGIMPERVHLPPAKILKVERLFATQKFDGRNEYLFYPDLFYSVRDRILHHLARKYPDGLLNLGKRIYIARRPSADRGVVRLVRNEAELLQKIEAENFTYVCMEDYSFMEQVSIVANADIVLAPHGAGMALTMFMPRDSMIIEMFSPEYVNPCMTASTFLLNQRYHMLTSQVLPFRDEYRNVDMTVPVFNVRQILHSLRPSKPAPKPDMGSTKKTDQKTKTKTLV